MKIALLSYRSHPRVGGQGVYVHYLSRALLREGHEVEVFSGPPYPELDESVTLTRVPSLDLYREDDPFRRPKRSEFRGPIDVLEYGVMCAAGFPEPLTFSLRVARMLARRKGDFDVVHDNQCLGYGLLSVARDFPLVATVHHPITIDRRLALAAAADSKERARLRRWYGFCRMQKRVARKLPKLITVSVAARDDVAREFAVPADRIDVVANGVDADLFRPLPSVRGRGGRIIAVSSADLPMKGVSYLIEAVAKLRTEREVELTLIGEGGAAPGIRALVKRFSLEGAVNFEQAVEPLRLAELYAGAQVAVVPSLYEGFSLPAVEAMSSGVPLVATTGGALPEVVGADGDAALLVPPGDAGAIAQAVGTLLDDERLRHRLGAAGRARVLERFTWAAAAQKLTSVYERALSC